MRTGFFKGVVLGAVVSTGVLLAASAVAGTGLNGVFNLGKTNTVDATTTLAGASTKTLQLQNTGTGPALGLSVKSGQPPLTTSSGTKVVNLNADSLDGVDSKGFVQGGGNVVSGRLTQANPTGEADVLSVPGFGRVRAGCDADGYTMHWMNNTSPGVSLTMNWRTSSGGFYTVLPAGDEVKLTTNNLFQLIELQTSYVGGHVATVTIAAHFGGLGGCIYSAQAVAQ